MRGEARFVVVALLLAGCPADDSGGGGETDSSTGNATNVTMSGPTSAASTSSSSTTADATSSSDTGEPSTSTGTPETTGSGSGDGSSSSGSGTASCEGMSFFATSVGSGKNGGNLGGLAGADATCQMLADAVGQDACTWHAYLSTSTEDARDRIGAGPWFNANGDMIAADVDALHTDGLSNGDPQHVFDENGAEVPGNEHDILTGSNEDGTLMPDTTCDDWTSSDGAGARVGHSDIPDNPMFSPSWNSAHTTPGCGAADLAGVGGAGRLYCFAID